MVFGHNSGAVRAQWSDFSAVRGRSLRPSLERIVARHRIQHCSVRIRLDCSNLLVVDIGMVVEAVPVVGSSCGDALVWCVDALLQSVDALDRRRSEVAVPAAAENQFCQINAEI